MFNKNNNNLFKRFNQDNLNSRSTKTNNPMDYYRNSVANDVPTTSQMFQRFQVMRFETRIADVKGPTIELEKLENLKIQDVYKWTNQFRMTMRRCNIENEIEKCDFLMLCVSDKFYDLLLAGKTVEPKLSRLCNLVYNSENFEMFKNHLKGLKL